MKRLTVAIIVSIGLALGVAAQDAPAPGDTPPSTTQGSDPSAAGIGSLLFNLGLGIGFESIPDAAGVAIGWQKLALTPDLSIGPFGVGLDVTFHMRFDGGTDGKSFEILESDWVPQGTVTFQGVLETYLPKIRYVRLGKQGEPIFVQAGDIPGETLGNGFLVGGYTNTVYRSENRIFGLLADFDSAVFKFPLGGVQTMVSNLGSWDLLALRAFVRPLFAFDIPILKDMQFGFTIAADTNPGYFNPAYVAPADPASDDVVAWDIDFRQPIIGTDAVSLSVFGDIASENSHLGGQVGVGASFLKAINLLAIMRFTEDNFIPSYFDAIYDATRETRYAIYHATTTVIPAYTGFMVSAGFSLLDGAVGFNANFSGPFSTNPAVEYQNPDLSAHIWLKDGILAGFSADASYTKKNITSLSDLISANNAVITAKVGYKAGPATVSLVYNIRYDELSTTDPWKVSSSLETSISLF